MKIYRCITNDANGNYLSWHASKREADKSLREQQTARSENEEESCGVEGVESVEIDTTKSGLIAWLNLNLTTAND